MIASLIAIVAKLPAVAWKWLAIGAAVLIAVIWIHRYGIEQRDTGAQTVRDSLAATVAVHLQHKLDSAAVKVVHDSVTVTRTIHRVDTLLAHIPDTIRTKADTVSVLDHLPEFKRATDSAIASCQEFQVSCSEYRRVADSLEYARRDQIAALNAKLGTLQPKRYQTVLHWAEIGAAFYIGMRVKR